MSWEGIHALPTRAVSHSFQTFRYQAFNPVRKQVLPLEIDLLLILLVFMLLLLMMMILLVIIVVVIVLLIVLVLILILTLVLVLLRVFSVPQHGSRAQPLVAAL